MEHPAKERPKVGIGVIVVRDGKILLGKRIAGHGSGTYSLPGGHLEFGETFEETATREVAEETGLRNITVKGLISVSNDIAYDKHYVTLCILTESTEGTPYPAEPDKCQNWAWYDPTGLPDNIFIPSKKAIENWLAGTVYTP